MFTGLSTTSDFPTVTNKSRAAAGRAFALHRDEAHVRADDAAAAAHAARDGRLAVLRTGAAARRARLAPPHGHGLSWTFTVFMRVTMDQLLD